MRVPDAPGRGGDSVRHFLEVEKLDANDQGTRTLLNLDHLVYAEPVSDATQTWVNLSDGAVLRLAISFDGFMKAIAGGGQ